MMDGAPAASHPRRKGEVRVLASARRHLIRQIIDEKGQIAVSQLAAQLNVSEMTVRRDLDHLAAAGLVSRDHGGATMIPANAAERDEPAFNLRDRTATVAKTRIARLAASLVEPGHTIGLDTGSTVHRLAKELASVAGLRLFTSNLRTAGLLASGASPVYALGGAVRPGELSIYGSVANAQLRELWLDTVFIGVSGLSKDGLSDYSVEDSDIKRVFIERANTVVLVCDATKFDRRSLMMVCGLGDVHVLVTDAPPPDELAEALARAGVRVIVADGEAGAAHRPG